MTIHDQKRPQRHSKITQTYSKSFRFIQGGSISIRSVLEALKINKCSDKNVLGGPSHTATREFNVYDFLTTYKTYKSAIITQQKWFRRWTLIALHSLGVALLWRCTWSVCINALSDVPIVLLLL